MRRNRQVIAIALMIMAVIGLSVGFAAFSNTLTIRSTAEVNPNASDFRLVFANNTNVNNLDTTSPVQPLNQSTLGGNATIANESVPKLRGLTANFTAPGQSVSYRVYIVNTGKYTAYLTNLVFSASNGSDYNTCTPIGNTSSSLVETACDDIYVTVQIDNQTFRSDAVSLENTISNMSIAPNENHEVIVTITYADNGNYTDGDFRVTFGDIMIQYRTIDSPTQTIEVPSQEPTDSSCFVSVIPGQINDYLCSDTDLVIQDNLQLGTRSVESISFNSQKCAAFESMIAQLNPNYTCTNLSAQFNQLKSNPQQLYSTFLGAFATATYGDESSTKNNITTIGNGVFSVKSLTGVELGEGITSVSDYAFLYNSISNLKFPSTLTSVGNYAFEYNNLGTIDLKNVQSIGDEAFHTNQLVYLDIPNSVTSIGKWSFANNDLQSVSFGSGLTSTGDGAFQFNQITNIDFSRATNLTTIDRAVFLGNNLTNVTIPNSVTTIADDAFRENYLTNVTIPNSVTTIGYRAFDVNSLTSVTLGTGITTIVSGAFNGNTGSETMYDGTVRNYGPNKITNVTINALKANVNGIDIDTFGYDSNANCTNTVASDWKSNTCITWVNG